MSKISFGVDNQELMFWCPGCDGIHMIRHGECPRPGWTWNGSVDRPTFSPSILVSGTKITEKGRAEIRAWSDAGYPKHEGAFDSVPNICHSFVTDGRIRFLSDCTHALAGQTVDLPEWEP